MNAPKSVIFGVAVWLLFGSFFNANAQTTKHYINVHEYNAEQKRRAIELFRDLTKQQRPLSCQTNAAIGLAYLTGVLTSPNKVYVPTEKTVMSPEEFYDLLVRQGWNPFKQEAEIIQSINPGTTLKMVGKLDSMSEKMNIIADAVDDGRPVLVGLNARPIWEALYKKSNQPPDPNWPKDKNEVLGHTLTVVGLKRDNEGDILGFYIRDTGLGEDGGKGAGYYSDAADFTKAITPFNTRIFIPGRRAIDMSGDVLKPIKFVQFAGEWKSSVGDILDAWYTPAQGRLTFSYKKPPSHRKKDEVHGWIESTGNDNQYVRKAFTYYGCSLPQRVFPVVVDERLSSTGPALTITIKNVPTGWINTQRGCTESLTGMREVVYEKIGSKVSGWKPDPDFTH